MSRVSIQFDECKPHWAKQRRYDVIAAELGMKNVRITGDFDSKIAYVIGDVDNFEQFRALAENSLLSEGSVCELQVEGSCS